MCRSSQIHSHMVSESGSSGLELQRMENNVVGDINVNGVNKQTGIGEIGGRRRRETYVNSLSSREMESLTAISDAFLPPVNVEKDDIDESAVEYYRTSASMAGTPLHIGWMLSERVQHPKLWLIRRVLWLLSTWIGTLIICGRASLSNNFPYVQNISQVSQLKKEEILRSWSQSSIPLFRTLYLGAKILVSLVFFSQVNEKDENLSWKAIDYTGPDPELKIKTKNAQISSFQDSEYLETDASLSKKEELYGPLYRGLIDLKQPGQIVVESLQRSSFQVSSLLPINKRVPPNLSIFPSKTIKCDAVIVGSGAGGGVVAGILAKAGYKVIVLEKGSYRARSNLSLLEGPTMDQMYLGNGLLASSDMGVVLLAGSTVGGGSTINWAASVRTPQHVLNEWSEVYGIELFQSGLYKEAMDAVCEKMGVQSEVENEGLSSMVLRKGCNELGYSVTNVPRNSPPDHYCGWCCLGCKDGKKKSTSETWLVDLVNSGNGVILPGCEAVQVLHNKKKGRGRSTASGVVLEFQYGGRKERFLVESTVTIAAAGALCTPELLKRSGLKNPNIGRNLHLHPVTMAWGYFPETEKKSYEGEILTAMSTVVGNFKTSGYGAIIQTPALHPGMFSALMPWVSGIEFKKRMSKFSRTAHVFALARDKGSGVLASPTSISYRMDKTDEENLQRGIERVLRILAAAGAEEIGTHHCEGKTVNVKKASSSEFEKFVKEESLRGMRDLSTPICSAHQMGSCRMGVEPKGSAVNPMGETWEVEGLYVADSSVFPTALGVNPMVTIQAIAYCTAQSVLEALSRKKNVD